MGRDPIQESNKLQAITKARERNPWKRALRVFLLLSLLLLSYYSSCLHSINLSSTTTLLNNLDHFINRKAIFLLFNAILLFLVEDSGLLSLSSHDRRMEMIEGRGDEEEIAAMEDSGRSLELAVIGGGGDEEGKELVGEDEIKDVGIDELNRKIEEFIERVKRERRITEALQLVMV